MRSKSEWSQVARRRQKLQHHYKGIFVLRNLHTLRYQNDQGNLRTDVPNGQQEVPGLAGQTPHPRPRAVDGLNSINFNRHTELVADMANVDDAIFIRPD
jgi:hypothetical protein